MCIPDNYVTLFSVATEAHSTFPCKDTHKPTDNNITEETFRDLGNETYVYSAYLDSRTNLVRIFGITRYFYNHSAPIYCLLWYEDASDPEVTTGTLIPWDVNRWGSITEHTHIYTMRILVLLMYMYTAKDRSLYTCVY